MTAQHILSTRHAVISRLQRLGWLIERTACVSGITSRPWVEDVILNAISSFHGRIGQVLNSISYC